MDKTNKMVERLINSSNVRRVSVEVYDKEEIELKENGEELIICVPQSKFTSMLMLAEEMNRKLDERYKTINSNEYIDEEEYIEPESKKRNIKGPKIFDKPKRFIATLLLGATLITGGVVASKIPEYKEEQSERILNLVKEELDVDHIYDRSSNTGSNTGVIKVVAEKDGKEYEYFAHTQDGKVIRIDRNELSDEAVEAIQIAANAQNGNVFDAIRADRYADKIEKGEVELEKIGENNLEKDDYER